MLSFFRRKVNLPDLANKAQQSILRGEWTVLSEYIDILKMDIERKEKELLKCKKLYEELTEVTQQ